MAHGRIRGRCLLLVIAVLLACRKPDYFPLKENQEWRFAGVSEVSLSDFPEQESVAYAIKVTGSAVEPGLGRVYEVRVTRNDEAYMSCFVRKTKDAVYVLPASHLDGFEPTSGWVKFLELPLREGGFWYGDAERSVSFDVVVREEWGVPAGLYRDCWRVRLHAPMPYGFTFWLAPGAGIIRWTRRLSVVKFELAERLYR
jgi:hypothetical protein